MKSPFKAIRLRQLEKSLASFTAAKHITRPQKGWLRALREVTGLTLREIGHRLGISASSAAYLERAEEEYRITLGNLRDAADALGCQLVYALVPKDGSLQELVEQRFRNKAAEDVHAVEHTMALEDQAVGGVEDKIDELTRRSLKRA